MPPPRKISYMRFVLLVAAMAALSCGPEPAKKEPLAPEKKAPPPASYRVKLETSKGDIVIEVQREWAPRAADRFYELVQDKYYDGSRFHRVIRQFIAQFGVHRDPAQNRLWRELKMPDDPVKKSNKRGWLSFAHNGPNTRSTQVFINLRDNVHLDKSVFAPFANVISGMDVVDKLYYSYGELAPKGSGPDPTKTETQGNAYLEDRFPRLDYIKTARIE
jgi:peptidyl-prolyl cis-trans isomerase A (cyclophilin A)